MSSIRRLLCTAGTAKGIEDVKDIKNVVAVVDTEEDVVAMELEQTMTITTLKEALVEANAEAKVVVKTMLMAIKILVMEETIAMAKITAQVQMEKQKIKHLVEEALNAAQETQMVKAIAHALEWGDVAIAP